MYQRRSVADTPVSPTAARSRAAIRKWNAQIRTKTSAIHAPCDVTSQFGSAGHVASGLATNGPELTVAHVSISGRSTEAAVIASETRAPIDPARHAQYRYMRRIADARSAGSRLANRRANQ